MSKGNKVIDLGAAPGSWTEYIIEILGKSGSLWAIDERPLSITALEKIEKIGLRFEFVQQSVMDDLPETISDVDLLVSDLAPWTGGNKLVDSSKSLILVERAYEVASKHLKVGGHFVVKLFQSQDSIEMAKSWEKRFKFAKLTKPPSTHKESKEIYFVGQHFRP